MGTLLKLLEQIDTDMARNMLEDLRDPERCTPQLYNAINKFLDRHKFHIDKLQPEGDVLGNLGAALQDFKETQDMDLAEWN